MKLEFTKMQGCGNDYVYVNGFTQKIPANRKKELIPLLSDRHFGIGSDGVIFINPSETADFEMEMYNADGSRAEMCGNGIRCVAKYVYDHKMTDKDEITIASFDKVKPIRITAENGVAKYIRVDMGIPELDPEKIPVISEQERVINEPIEAGGREYAMTCVSMGNPHAVIFEDPDEVGLETAGPLIENHRVFPNRVNVEFVKILDRKNVRMRVWERGTGETLACGTGCCATAVACILNGYTDRSITVHVLGGDIEVEWDEADGRIYMTGPAETVFDGIIDIG
ncbi:MAG: diaminopimelate epimerase [Lachnospiraceae bacterium]|nr:diaminopimelate epimerase [Lachnospiraceae bacterium]